MTTASGAIALHQGPPPDGPPRHVLTVKVKGEDQGDELRAYVATDDAGYGLFAQLVLETSTECGKLQLWKSASGTTTKLAETIVPELLEDVWHTLQVCFRPANDLLPALLSANVRTGSGFTRALAYETTSVGLLAGVGTGALGAMAKFDNFCWQRHYIRAEYSDGYETVPADPTCPKCGLPTCAYAEDDFSRPDNDDPGCPWQEMSGDWSIDDQQLLASATGLIKSTAQHPEGKWSMVLTGKAILHAVGDAVRAIVGYASPDDYVALEITLGDNCAAIKLIERDGGVESDLSVIGSIPGAVPGTLSFWVCLGRRNESDTASYLVGAVGSYSVQSGYPVSGFGDRAALAVQGITSTVEFDDITLQFAYDDDHQECPPCFGYLGCAWAGTEAGPGIPCNWEVLSGVWSPWSLTTSSNAKAMTTTQNPSGNVMQATGFASGSVDGDEAKIFLAGDAIVATLRFDSPCGSIEISGPGGSNSCAVRGLVPGTAHWFCVSFSGSAATLGVALSPGSSTTVNERLDRQIAVATSAPSDGVTAGIGTGSVSGQVSIVASFTKLWENDHTCLPCSTCWGGRYHYQDSGGVKCEFEQQNGTLGGTIDSRILLSAAGEYGMMNAGTSGARFVETLVTSSAPGQIIRVHAANDSLRNGPWVELVFGNRGSGLNGTLRLSSGQSVPVGKYDGDNAVLQACVRGSQLTGTLDPAPGQVPPAWATLYGAAAAAGDWGGVSSTGAGGVLAVSNFVAGRLTNAITGGVCNDCVRVCAPCANQQFPAAFLVEVFGISGDGCCANYNGAYVANTLNACQARWEHSAGWDPCLDPGFVSVVFEDQGTKVRISVSVYHQPFWPAAGYYASYRIDVPKPLDCTAINALHLPMYGSFSVCQTASSYVLLTAA